MNRIRFYQRQVYDFSRRFVLPGRNQLLSRIPLQAEKSILEIGCGAGQNLIQLARCNPEVNLAGLDTSGRLLARAKKQFQKTGLEKIRLARCAAVDFDTEITFGQKDPFDVIFFSYSLSMNPAWHAALRIAMANLAPHGCIYIADFWDEENKGFLRWSIRNWLGLFGIRYDHRLITYLRELDSENEWSLDLTPVAGGCAFVARISPCRNSREAQLPLLDYEFNLSRLPSTI